MQETFSNFGKALIRTPLYSWRRLFNADGSTRSLESFVHGSLSDPVFLEALYWSSPQLHERVQQLKSGMLKAQKEKNLLHTLAKYLIRAHTRATPYGIFAGTGLTGIDVKVRSALTEIERKVRADSGLLQHIRRRIETDPAVYPRLRYLLNNTLYRIPGQFRFTECLTENGTTRYQLSSLENTPLLDTIYRVMAGRQFTADEIFEQSATETSFEVFNEFFKELTQSQFLVSELCTGPTITDEINRCLRALKRLQAEGVHQVEKYIDLLSSLSATAANFQNLPPGNLPLEEIKKIEAQMEKCSIMSYQGHLFHVDLKKTPPPGCILTSEQVTGIMKGVQVLAMLSRNGDTTDRMASFKNLFLKKYGSREIRLSEALDPEYGIGFPALERIGSTLFNSLTEHAVREAEKNRQNSNEGLLPTTGLVYSPTVEEIKLTDKDLPGSEEIMIKIPSYFSVMGSLLPSGQILLEGVGKAHANALPGRFADLEPGINELCKEIAASEQMKNQKVVFAEIVFQPAGRTGNIARRPSFFEYEIPYLAAAGVEKEKQLPVNDLLLSIRNNEIVLRSERLNKRIIPRLSNAHNFTTFVLPVYQFLSSMQYPDEINLEIDWGNPGFNRRFLPRVTYENLILHRARWFLYQDDITQIVSGDDPIKLLADFISAWKVSRFVALPEGDKELLIDTHNAEYLGLLLKEMQKRTMLKLIEWPLDITASRNTEDTIQQFILPLAKKNAEQYLPFVKPGHAGSIRGSFAPGSEWMYFKIYCSAGFSDRVLAAVVKPSFDLLLKQEMITKAFFIRYTDPHYHIRLRFHLREDAHLKNFAGVPDHIYKRIQSFSDEGIIWDMQLATYRPETERYGYASMTASETAFFYDSQLFLRCLDNEEFQANDEMRFLSAIKNLDRWLSLTCLSLKEKLTFCEAMVKSFAKEFGPETKFPVDLKYRQLSYAIPAFFESPVFETEFKEREASLLKLCLPQKNFGSYIHMSMNRWFVTDQRLLEYMSYIFAARYYQQMLYHAQKTNSPKSNGNKV